jgi:hypothetical protein
MAGVSNPGKRNWGSVADGTLPASVTAGVLSILAGRDRLASPAFLYTRFVMIIYYSSSTSGSARNIPEMALKRPNIMLSFHAIRNGEGVTKKRWKYLTEQRTKKEKDKETQC